MNIIFGGILGILTIIYWGAFLSSIPRSLKMHLWKDNPFNSLLNKLFTVFAFIIFGIIGYFLIKWTAQLLGIIN